MHYAASCGNTDFVEALLTHGADCTIPGSDGLTPVAAAIKAGYYDIAELLVKSLYKKQLSHSNQAEKTGGASLDAQLFASCSSGNLNEVIRLVSEGSNVNSKDDYLVSCVHRAAATENMEVLEYVLEKGGEVNVQDHLGNTPLHFAAFKNNYNSVRLLLSNGADPLMKNCDGMTALHLAQLCGFGQIVALLQTYIANPTAPLSASLQRVDNTASATFSVCIKSQDAAMVSIEKWTPYLVHLSEHQRTLTLYPPGASPSTTGAPGTKPGAAGVRTIDLSEVQTIGAKDTLHTFSVVTRLGAMYLFRAQNYEEYALWRSMLSCIMDDAEATKGEVEAGEDAVGFSAKEWRTEEMLNEEEGGDDDANGDIYKTTSCASVTGTSQTLRNSLNKHRSLSSSSIRVSGSTFQPELPRIAAPSIEPPGRHFDLLRSDLYVQCTDALSSPTSQKPIVLSVPSPVVPKKS